MGEREKWIHLFTLVFSYSKWRMRPIFITNGFSSFLWRSAVNLFSLLLPTIGRTKFPQPLPFPQLDWMPVARLLVMTTEIKLHKLSPIYFTAVAKLLCSSTVLLTKKKKNLRKSLQITNFSSCKMAYSELMNGVLLKYPIIPSVNKFQLQILVNDLG
jgi:hypothetical protein